MEVRGKLFGSKWQGGSLVVAFSIEANESVKDLAPDELYDITVVKHREKRSNDANAYYQVLSHKIAQEMGISHTEYHNKVLAEIGCAKKQDGKMSWILAEDSDWWLKQLEGKDHYCPTDKTEKKNGIFRWFYLLKPTREYNSKEMSTLIDYVVQDAKELDIETKTPEEIKRMTEAWNVRD